MARVVVVDDEVTMLNMVRWCLCMDDHTVFIFSDAVSALSDVDFTQIDLVITDLKMSTSGEEFIQTLRDRGVQIPIIVMSGHISQSALETLKMLNVGAFLTKPFTLNDLRSAIEQCF